MHLLFVLGIKYIYFSQEDHANVIGDFLNTCMIALNILRLLHVYTLYHKYTREKPF